MAAGKDVLYLLLEQNTEVEKRDVYLADVAQMECTNAEALNRLKTIKILKIPPVKKFRKVQNVVDIITEVQKLYPDNEIVMNPLSLSVACHIGPGSIAVTCTKKLPENM